MASVYLVIPCFNEAARLALDDFSSALERSSELVLLFVDDGSTDQTNALLRAHVDAWPERCLLLTLAQNAGKAEAVRRGMLAAFERGANYAGYWDADLSAPLSELDEMVALLDRTPHALMVMGARVKLLGRKVVRNALRHYAGRAFATGASNALGIAVYDTQCGAKLLRGVEPVRRAFDRPFASRWAFDVELIARLVHRSAAPADQIIVEYPLLQWIHVDQSRVKPWSLLRAALDLARIYGRRRFGKDVRP